MKYYRQTKNTLFQQDYFIGLVNHKRGSEDLLLREPLSITPVSILPSTHENECAPAGLPRLRLHRVQRSHRMGGKSGYSPNHSKRQNSFGNIRRVAPSSNKDLVSILEKMLEASHIQLMKKKENHISLKSHVFCGVNKSQEKR